MSIQSNECLFREHHDYLRIICVTDTDLDELRRIIVDTLAKIFGIEQQRVKTATDTKTGLKLVFIETTGKKGTNKVYTGIHYTKILDVLYVHISFMELASLLYALKTSGHEVPIAYTVAIKILNNIRHGTTL